jgi:hypothetical protein
MGLSENDRAKAHHGAALFDGDAEIARHAHRYLTKCRFVTEIFFLQIVENRFQPSEFLPYFVPVVNERSHSHDTMYGDVFEGSIVSGGEQVFNFFARQSEFGLFTCYMKLQQAGDDPFVSVGLLVDLGEQLQTVDALYQTDEGGDVFNLIGLKMTYEMPLYVARQQGLFGHQLLHPVLAKVTVTGVIGFHDIPYAMQF